MFHAAEALCRSRACKAKMAAVTATLAAIAMIFELFVPTRGSKSVAPTAQDEFTTELCQPYAGNRASGDKACRKGPAGTFPGRVIKKEAGRLGKGGPPGHRPTREDFISVFEVKHEGIPNIWRDLAKWSHSLPICPI